jgi:hypothetical protein
MKRTFLSLGSFVAVLLLSAGPALAQRPEPGAGSADRGGGGGGGGAVSSGGGGGGGNVASSGSSGGSSSSSSGSMSPSVSSVSSPSIGMGDRGFRSSAPEHRVSFSDRQTAVSRGSSGGGQQPAPRSSGDGTASAPSAPARTAPSAGGERAVSRGGAASNANPAVGRRASETAAGSNNVGGTQEVPSWARSRGTRPATDSAVPREGPMPPRSASDRLRSGGYYDPYYYGGVGYGFGFYTGFCSPAYYSCDQGFYGYPFYSPFGFGYGIPSGYFDPYYSDPYNYGAGYGAYSSQVYGGHDQGSLKVKVKPRNAKVYVDGFYVGVVDEFDGAFQKLTLNGGRHKVELRADGYETTEFDVLITPEQTVTFAGDMKKVQ